MTPAAHPQRLVIATRRSALALWQAEHVRSLLCAHHPGCAVDLLGLTTEGDRVLDVPLSEMGGKGLFIKELEQAMLDGRADLAVHSLKDVPMQVADGFTLAAILERDDPRDALVCPAFASLEALPSGSVVGTSSLRREAQLRERHPTLRIEPLRGNVNTRLRKLDEGRYVAIVLAAAGLRRLDLASRITALLEPETSLPAIGQAALAVECRSDRPDVIAAVAVLADAPTTLAVAAERAFGLRLGGDCRTPLAALAVPRTGTLWLRGLAASRDGTAVLRGEREAPVQNAADAVALGDALAADLLARGAARVLAPRA